MAGDLWPSSTAILTQCSQLGRNLLFVKVGLLVVEQCMGHRISLAIKYGNVLAADLFDDKRAKAKRAFILNFAKLIFKRCRTQSAALANDSTPWHYCVGQMPAPKNPRTERRSRSQNGMGLLSRYWPNGFAASEIVARQITEATNFCLSRQAARDLMPEGIAPGCNPSSACSIATVDTGRASYQRVS